MHRAHLTCLAAAASVWLSLLACPPDPGNGGDAGVTDAGADAGLTDAGHDDGGQTDAGADAGYDAGTDAGTDAGLGDGGCDHAQYDAVLGTAQLSSAYRVVDSAALPVGSWLPIAAMNELLPDGGSGTAVYGYTGDGFVHRLGLWPNLQAPSAQTLSFDAVPAADRSRQFIIAPTLARSRDRLLAGYRTIAAQAFVDGGVTLFDSIDAGQRWLAAPGIGSALGLGSFFLVGADGLGPTSGGRGIWSLKADDSASQPLQAATYPSIANEQVLPGLMAVTENGVVALGYYLDLAARHSVRIPLPSALSAALAGTGPAVDLSQAPELTTANDIANMAGFGQALAVLHTTKVRGIMPALGRLDVYPTSRQADVVQVGAPITALSANDDACTVVTQLVSYNSTLIIGLWDKNGQRLVRLAPQ